MRLTALSSEWQQAAKKRLITPLLRSMVRAIKTKENHTYYIYTLKYKQR